MLRSCSAVFSRLAVLISGCFFDDENAGLGSVFLFLLAVVWVVWQSVLYFLFLCWVYLRLRIVVEGYGGILATLCCAGFVL